MSFLRAAVACVLLASCAKSPSGAPATIAATRAPQPAALSAPRSNASETAPPVARSAGASAIESGAVRLSAKGMPLPGATAPVSLDFIAYERGRARIWVPVGDTGSVDVLDLATGSFARVDGFKTLEQQVRGKRRVAGPSAAAIGDGFVYVGNRATSEVCAVEAGTLKLGGCLKLPSPTDCVAYVASAKEVWVTTPHDHSLVVLDASRPDTLKTKMTIVLDGAPEGYAVDEARGLFLTNLEDKNLTVAIDLAAHKRKATWKLDCGEDGPRGIAVDGSRSLVFVACTDHVQVLDGARDGSPLAVLDTGGGVDNIDWLDTRHLLYVAAAKAARLTVARFDDKGQPTVVAVGESAQGARNAVADTTGNAYVADPMGAKVLVFEFPPVVRPTSSPTRAERSPRPAGP
jgi:DNA-binding beta-propeller fold protein YncE